MAGAICLVFAAVIVAIWWFGDRGEDDNGFDRW